MRGLHFNAVLGMGKRPSRPSAAPLRHLESNESAALQRFQVVWLRENLQRGILLVQDMAKVLPNFAFKKILHFEPAVLDQGTSGHRVPFPGCLNQYALTPLCCFEISSWACA